MGSKEIRAGGAAVEISGKDNLTGSLNRISAKFKGFAAGIRGVGSQLASSKIGLGSILTEAVTTVGIAGAVKAYAAAGATLHQLSQRTGMTVEQLSKLKYAAAVTHVELDDVANGLRGMDKFMGKVNDGGEETQKTLHHLGLTAADLKGLNPDQLFEKLATGVGRVADPTERAALAMQVFGRGGALLLPVINNLAALQKEAEEMGFVMSEETAEKAHQLERRLTLLGMASKGVFSAIGSIFVDDVIAMAQRMMDVILSIRNWVRSNKELVGSVLRVATTIAAVGSGVIFLALGVSTLGMVLGGIATVAGVVSSVLTTVLGVIAAIASPIGIAIVAIIGLAAYLTWASGAAGEAADFIRTEFNNLVADSKAAFGAISNALAAGDLSAAAAVVWALLKLEWTKGINFLNSKWTEWSTFFNQVGIEASFGLANAMVEATALIIKAWNSMTGTLKSIWNNWLDFVEPSTGFLANAMLYATSSSQADYEQKKKALESGLKIDRRKRQEAREAKPVDDAKRQADLDADTEAKRKKLKDAYDARTAANQGRGQTGTADADKALADAQAAFDAAKAKAESLTPLSRPKKIPGGPGDLPDLPEISAAGKSSGTFSAAAAGRLGGDSLATRTANATERTAKNTDPKNRPQLGLGAGFA